MSLILDALNKADRERDYRDAVPDLNTIHGGIRRDGQRRFAWLVAILGSLVVVLAVVVAALWLRSPAVDSAAPAEPVQPAVEPVPPATPFPSTSAPAIAATAPAAAETVSSAAAAPELELFPTTAVGVNPEIEALYQVQADAVVQEVTEPEVQAALSDTLVEEPLVTKPAHAKPSVDAELARTLWEEAKRQQQYPVPLPPEAKTAAAGKSPASAPAPAIKAPLEETLAGYAETPFLHELPPTVQNTIPTLMYARHDYSQGLVVINKADLRAGDATNGGVQVERVLADGVLLSLQGTEFKLSSLSSWVNY